MVALADAQPAGEVVHPERAAEQTREPSVDHAAACEQRDEEREDAHEMRRVLERALAFVERLVDEADLTLLEVAQATVHELGALRARARREVVALDQRGAQAPAGGVERHPGAGDATTDHQDVELLVAEPAEDAARSSGARPTGWRSRGRPAPGADRLATGPGYRPVTSSAEPPVGRRPWRPRAPPESGLRSAELRRRRRYGGLVRRESVADGRAGRGCRGRRRVGAVVTGSHQADQRTADGDTHARGEDASPCAQRPARHAQNRRVER